MVKSTTRIIHDWSLINYLKDKNFGSVLDVGAKDRRYRRYINCKSYKSLDVDPAYGVDIVADVEFYESEEKYDMILMTQVGEHLKNPEIAFKNISNLLKDGGILIMTTPFIFQNHGSQDYWRWSEHALRLMLCRYFRQVKVDGYGNFLSSSWCILHFFNKIPMINWAVAFGSQIFGSQHCPNGFLTEAIK